MQQGQALVEDLEFDTERRHKCQGAALVRFEYLKWAKQTWRPDPKHVDHLKWIFQKEGCRALEVGHHIPALVDQHRLDAALDDARRKGRWTADCLPTSNATVTENGYPELDFPGGIDCLRGRHRVQAAWECREVTEEWWIVDLYPPSISDGLRTLLIDEYTKQERPSDGKIYRKIREYQLLPCSAENTMSPSLCTSFENRWWAWLHPTAAKKLRRLFLRRQLTAAFDALQRSPGIFDAGMMISTLHKVLSTHCYEEIQWYLEKHTIPAWNGFLSGVREGLQRIDHGTVNAMQCRAPGASTLDAQFVRGELLGGSAFGGFSDQERAVMVENILPFRRTIPSLYTFFQDIHFLEACADSVKWLVTVPPGQSLFKTLGDCYKRTDETQYVQMTEDTIWPMHGSQEYCKRLGYLGLIAFTMRHYSSLP
ncbi:hypothetical protein OIDMADRAFT_138367, partial [Oidiodendron maius Zn]